MGLLVIDFKSLKEIPVKTTPENVKEANEGLFRARMTLPAAAKHCGMTQKEMKLTFREYLKYHPKDYDHSKES
jgi:predicted Ser/Thr protein kinase